MLSHLAEISQPSFNYTLRKGLTAMWQLEVSGAKKYVKPLCPNLSDIRAVKVRQRGAKPRSAVCLLMFPEQHLSCSRHMRCEHLSHFK